MINAGEVMSSVYPSGSDFATVAMPIMPPAPPWFSMIICLPRRSESLGAIARPMMSVLPPGANGPIPRTSLLGYESVAAAAAESGITRASAPSAPMILISRTLRFGNTSIFLIGISYLEYNPGSLQRGKLARIGCIPESFYLSWFVFRHQRVPVLWQLDFPGCQC